MAILYAKDLVEASGSAKSGPEKCIRCLRPRTSASIVTRGKTSLSDCFALCKRERRHLLVVVEKISKSLCGIVTTEDILEEILQDEIVGDDDQYIDQGNTSSYAAGPRAPGLRRAIGELLRSLSPRRAAPGPSLYGAWGPFRGAPPCLIYFTRSSARRLWPQRAGGGPIADRVPPRGPFPSSSVVTALRRSSSCCVDPYRGPSNSSAWLYVLLRECVAPRASF